MAAAQKNIVSVKQALSGNVPAGSTVTVRGWVRTRRDSKAGLSFVNVSDGSCFDPIQVVATGDLPNYADEVAKLTAGFSSVPYSVTNRADVGAIRQSVRIAIAGAPADNGLGKRGVSRDGCSTCGRSGRSPAARNDNAAHPVSRIVAPDAASDCNVRRSLADGASPGSAT